MTDDSTSAPQDPQDPQKPANADRIAKVMARAGVASRREAERMILEGRVSVNGKVIDSPALDVLPSDRITVDGKKLDEKQETRLWLYYKPVGLVTSEADEKGRQTVFDALPRDLPRVMTVGRLDLNSEGLLLLTNDGELKRRLELPATGWLRRYRVRVNGQPNDLTFGPLRRGATIDGEEFAPMEIRLDGQQGANAWLTVGIREGRNREIRRAMAHVGLQVNRLIRIGYGPFRLTGLEKNQVVEVKRRVLRDQLGGLLTGEAEEKEREMRPRGAGAPRGPRDRDGFKARGRDDGPRQDGPRQDGPRKPRGEGARGARASDGKSSGGKSWGARAAQGERAQGDRPRAAEGERAERPRRSFGAERPAGSGPRKAADGKPAAGRRFDKPAGEGRPAGKFGSRPDGKPGGKPGFKGPRGAGKGGADRGGPRPQGARPQGSRPQGPRGGKPSGRPSGKPRG